MSMLDAEPFDRYVDGAGRLYYVVARFDVPSVVLARVGEPWPDLAGYKPDNVRMHFGADSYIASQFSKAPKDQATEPQA